MKISKYLAFTVTCVIFGAAYAAPVKAGLLDTPAPAADAAAANEFNLVIKDHKFTPDTLEIPAGQQVKINVDNQDPTAEEFESHDLDREKVIIGNNKGVVLLGPLAAGTYSFVGEYHEDTAKGTIVVK